MNFHAVPKLAPFVAIVLSSCTLFNGTEKNQPPEQLPAPGAPRLVGRIASIPADKRFVLIQSYESWDLGTGTILTTRGSEDRTANLLVTGESLGQFAAADLQSGLVEVGDAVYSLHLPKASPAPSEPEGAPELPELP